MFILMLLVTLLPFVTFAQTEFEGEVSGEWTVEGSPYVQVGEAEIPAEESLTILPGVEVLLSEDMTLTCNGIITAEGTEEDTIRFHGPEGLISGNLQFTEGEDTLVFTYCRFDSLTLAIYGIGRTIIVEHCRFFNNTQTRISDGSAYFRNNHFHSDNGDGDLSLGFGIGGRNEGMENVLIEGHLTYQSRYSIIYAENVEFMSNRTSRHTPPNVRARYSTASIQDSRRIVFRDNIEHELALLSSHGWVEEAEIYNNILNRTTVGVFISAVANIHDNVIKEDLTITMARAEFTNNEILADVAISGRGNAVTEVLLEKNLITDWIVLGDSCYATLVNNTIVMHRRDSGVTGNIIRKSITETQFQSSVTLRNNILVSLNEDACGVESGVEYVDGGYNCFWGVEDEYEGREELLDHDFTEDPLFVGGNPPEYYLQANSPCIDAGDPDSPHDPDDTRADIGCYFFDQENGMPPAIISRHDMYIGKGMHFRYTARATDEGDAIMFEFEGLPDWLEIEENERRDFVSDSVVVSGDVPDDQEDFVFVVHAIDEDEMEDTLSVQVLTYPFTVLTGYIDGYLSRENSPYLVIDTAWVAEDDSLIIEPGCEIYCDDTINEGRYNSVLISNTYANVIGNEEDSIFFNTLNGSGSRQFLKVYGNHDIISEFRYCHLNGAGVTLIDHNVSITNCLSESVTFVRGDNIYFNYERNKGYGGSYTGSGIITNNEFGGAVIAGDTIDVMNNIIIENGLISVRSDIKLANIHNNIQESEQAGSFSIRISTMLGAEPSKIICKSNLIGHCDSGIEIGGENVDLKIVNNIINGAEDYGFEFHEDNSNVLISNNIISNSEVGFFLRNREGEYMNNYITVNNLLINNDTVLQLESSDHVYRSFRYNDCFDFDSLGNDTSYVGNLTQVNTNGDSCDTGFNIFLDPHIASLDSLDFRLYADSPLIDAGNPDSSFFDVDGTVNDIGLYGGPYGEEYEYPSGVGESDVPVPGGFTLDRPYPNPFNISTNFTFNLPAPGVLEINIYDTIGRLIFSDKLEELQAGSHRYTWQGIDSKGRPLPTGIYYFEQTYKGAKLVKRVVLLK